MLERMGLDDSHVKFVIKKIISITIRLLEYLIRYTSIFQISWQFIPAFSSMVATGA